MTSIPRRILLPSAFGVATMPAMAQPAAPAMGCATAPAFVLLRLEGTGAPAGTVTVFAHAFRAGDLPAGAGLSARAGRDALPAQVDVLNRHGDGSTRLAIVALACPALPAGRHLDVALSAAPPSGVSLDVAQALAGRQASVTITGAQRWQVDLAAAWRAAPATAWQAGPLAAQGRVVLPVPQAVAGMASLRLVADLSLRRDGTFWMDVWLRNDVAMQPGGGEVTCSVVVAMDGREPLRVDRVRQPQYTAWGRQLGSARGAPAPQPPLVRHDAGYLADAGVVPRYNTAVEVDERLLARFAAAMATPAWTVPLDPRGITQGMPSGGDRDDIGIATTSQAAWLVSGDRRAGNFAIGQAEATGSVPWHMWDNRGGSGSGGWLSLTRWPRLWTDARGGPPPGGLQQQVSADTGWSPDTAHQPDLCLVPFMMTGRRSFLDNLQAQAAWNLVAFWPQPRGNGDGLVVRGNQVRGAAWAMRTMGNAAWASPETDADGRYLTEKTQFNWRWLRAQLPAWTAQQGEAHGWLPGDYGSNGALPPWQQDHFASVTAIAAVRGDADARAVLDWMGNFIVGRFLSRERGFDPHDGAAYLIAISPENARDRPFRSWSEIAGATRARGWANAGGWAKTEGNYAQLAIASLAAFVDATGSEAAGRAHAWLTQANAPFTQRANYVREPKLSIVPMARRRGAGGRCAS